MVEFRNDIWLNATFKFYALFFDSIKIMQSETIPYVKKTRPSVKKIDDRGGGT